MLQESGHDKYPDVSTEKCEIPCVKKIVQENRFTGWMSVLKPDYSAEFNTQPRIFSAYIQNHIIIQPVILKFPELPETIA